MVMESLTLTEMETAIDGSTAMDGSMATAMAMNLTAMEGSMTTTMAMEGSTTTATETASWLDCNGGLNGNWDGKEVDGMEGIDDNGSSNGVLNGDNNGDGNQRLNCKGGLNGNCDGKEAASLFCAELRSIFLKLCTMDVKSICILPMHEGKMPLKYWGMLPSLSGPLGLGREADTMVGGGYLTKGSSSW